MIDGIRPIHCAEHPISNLEWFRDIGSDSHNYSSKVIAARCARRGESIWHLEIAGIQRHGNHLYHHPVGRNVGKCCAVKDSKFSTLALANCGLIGWDFMWGTGGCFERHGGIAAKQKEKDRHNSYRMFRAAEKRVRLKLARFLPYGFRFPMIFGADLMMIADVDDSPVGDIGVGVGLGSDPTGLDMRGH